MIVDVLYKCFVNEKIKKFAVLFLLLCRSFFVVEFHIVLIFIKLFIPFLVKLSSTHKMAIYNTYIFSIQRTVSLLLHVLIQIRQIPH